MHFLICQFVSIDVFTGLFPSLIFWIPCSFIMFFCLAYNAVNYEGKYAISFHLITVEDNGRFWYFINLLVFIAVLHPQLRCAMDCITRMTARRSVQSTLLHSTCSLFISYLLTNLIGGRYTDLAVNCGNETNSRYKWLN